jgi:signal transduction histidine kinase/CheY-like chemotaxis protein
MKKPSNFFLWIVLLAAALMITIAVAQIVTQQSLSKLRQGNKQATTTFTINNRLQTTINLAFELEAKMLKDKPADLVSTKRGIKDSLGILEYNMGVLSKLWPGSTDSLAINRLALFVKKQVALSFDVFNAIEKKNDALQKQRLDSLRKSHFGDSIYASSVTVQTELEKNLGTTLDQNNKAASQLSVLDRLLAGVALLAVLVLATIIIRRQVKQLSLIKDLSEARKVALQSAEAKDQFLANMSHEIRTPLNAIKGFGRILKQTQLNNDQQKYASIISTASDNLLNIVNDILDFSKIETGNLVLKKKTFSLTDIVNEVQMMFTALAQEKNLSLLFSVNQSIPAFVKGDPERLRQILVNLVSNAIKFTNAGKVSLRVDLTEDNSDNVKTRFVVADSGVGIPADKLDLIFERFEQIDHSFSRQQGGTGLGLAITKKLAEAMGGTIRVESKIGLGSEFFVDMPFEKVSEEALLEEKKQSDVNLGSVSVKGIRALVAEDNKMNQLLITSIFEKYDIVTDVVENGEEAVDAAISNKYDMVFMDVQMPKVDGLSATKALRKVHHVEVPIIAMTAHVLPGEREKCIDAGMDDYLSKPLDEDEVIMMIRKFSPVQLTDKVEEQVQAEHDWLNMAFLKSICNNDEKKIKMILNELKGQLPGEIQVFKESLSKMDIKELRKICHHLRSTLSPLNATAPALVALSKMHKMADNGAAEAELSPTGNILINELEAVVKELGEMTAV